MIMLTIQADRQKVGCGLQEIKVATSLAARQCVPGSSQVTNASSAYLSVLNISATDACRELSGSFPLACAYRYFNQISFGWGNKAPYHLIVAMIFAVSSNLLSVRTALAQGELNRKTALSLPTTVRELPDEKDGQPWRGLSFRLVVPTEVLLPSEGRRRAYLRSAQASRQGAEQLKEVGTNEAIHMAIAKYQEALRLWRVLQDEEEQAHILTGLASSYEVLGDWQQSLKFYGEASALLRSRGNRRQEINLLIKIGQLQAASGDRQAATRFYQQAMLLLRYVGLTQSSLDTKSESATIAEVGRIYDELGEKQLARNHYLSALDLKTRAKDVRGQASILSDLCSVWVSLNQLDKARTCYQQVLALRHTLQEGRGEATALNNLAGVYALIGERQQSLSYYQQALLRRGVFGDQRGEVITLSNMALVYEALGDMSKAINSYDATLLLHRALGNRQGELETLIHLGSLYKAEGNYPQALESYRQAFPQFWGLYLPILPMTIHKAPARELISR
jgi:tetratricopeptide (TPR) repeat protein